MFWFQIKKMIKEGIQDPGRVQGEEEHLLLPDIGKGSQQWLTWLLTEFGR